jgi:hypothetical protein
MAWLNRRTWKSLGLGLIGLLVMGGAARGQTPALLVLPPSNLKPGDTSQGQLSFACIDALTLKLLDCKVRAQLAPLDPTFGGHIAHVAPQQVGKVRDVNTPPGGGDVSVTVNTLNGYHTVVYEAPDASGRVEFVATWTPPAIYHCLFGVPPCVITDHFDIGLQGLNELFATSSDPFVFKPRPSADLHPSAHFGTVSLQQGIMLIGKTYADLTGGQRPRITDMSLPVGGLFDICGTFRVDGTCLGIPKGGHVAHRTGHDVDFSSTDDAGQSIDCVLQTTDAMKKAFKKANADFHQCYSDGHYHVRFQ